MALECKCHLDENRHAIWTSTINNFSCVKPSRSAADLPRCRALFSSRPETAASQPHTDYSRVDRVESVAPPLSFSISKKSETGQPAFYEKLEVWKPRSKRAPVVAVVKFHKLGVFVTQHDT